MVIGIRCRGGSTAMRDSEVTCGRVKQQQANIMTGFAAKCFQLKATQQIISPSEDEKEEDGRKSP